MFLCAATPIIKVASLFPGGEISDYRATMSGHGRFSEEAVVLHKRVENAWPISFPSRCRAHERTSSERAELAVACLPSAT